MITVEHPDHTLRSGIRIVTIIGLEAREGRGLGVVEDTDEEEE